MGRVVKSWGWGIEGEMFAGLGGGRVGGGRVCPATGRAGPWRGFRGLVWGGVAPTVKTACGAIVWLGLLGILTVLLISPSIPDVPQ